MSQQHQVPESPRQEFTRPKCPQCGTQMWIARIEPYDAAHDTRTYECPACNACVTQTVKFR